VKQKEFGVKGPEVTIIGQGTWYVDRGNRKSAVAALRPASNSARPTSIPLKRMAMPT
jgi:hypothetical protein